mgnify:CR=1 FL=1
MFEHYATGLLDCKEYQEIKSIYQEEQQAAKQNMKQVQLRGQNLLDQVKARMDWTEELLKYQRFQKIEKGIADRFIEKITVYSKDYVEIVFWFGDLFEKELEKAIHLQSVAQVVDWNRFGVRFYIEAEQTRMLSASMGGKHGGIAGTVSGAAAPGI